MTARRYLEVTVTFIGDEPAPPQTFRANGVVVADRVLRVDAADGSTMEFELVSVFNCAARLGIEV